MMMIAIFSAVCAYFASWLGHAFLQWIQALHRWQRRGNCFALLPLTKRLSIPLTPFLYICFDGLCRSLSRLDNDFIITGKRQGRRSSSSFILLSLSAPCDWSCYQNQQLLVCFLWTIIICIVKSPFEILIIWLRLMILFHNFPMLWKHIKVLAILLVWFWMILNHFLYIYIHRVWMIQMLLLVVHLWPCVLYLELKLGIFSYCFPITTLFSCFYSYTFSPVTNEEHCFSIRNLDSLNDHPHSF